MKEYTTPDLKIVIVEIVCDVMISKDTDFEDTDW